MPSTDTIIIGAGQAGLALSHHLCAAGADHVLLERARIGERWRSERWSSLHLLSPNWISRLPGSAPPADPHGFRAVADVVADLEAYARSFRAPVLERQPVEAVVRSGDGYRVRTGTTTWDAASVVVATGDCDRPRIPEVATDAPGRLLQLHAAGYRRPQELPAGGVLVVGAGPTGQQLALELRRAGRRVVLAVGSHVRMLRRYRGRDAFAWYSALGRLEQTIDEMPDPDAARRGRGAVLTGARGGEQLDLHVLEAAGVELAGRLVGFHGDVARFAGDLPRTIAGADAALDEMLASIDAHIRSTGALAPAPPARTDVVPPVRADRATHTVALRGFSTVLWATGYRRAYPWLHVPVVDAAGEIVHDHGATASPGLHVLGLRFQRHRGSHFIGGVGRDAGDLAVELLRRRPAVGLAA